MTQLSSNKGHIAQQNQWTKHCSWLMTQWDLLLKAWSMPFVLTLRLLKQCCDPSNTKDAKPARSLNCCYSALTLIVEHKPQFSASDGRKKKKVNYFRGSCISYWAALHPLLEDDCSYSCGAFSFLFFFLRFINTCINTAYIFPPTVWVFKKNIL